MFAQSHQRRRDRWLHQGWRLFSAISLSGFVDPEPASAAKK
ncbi:hypothetical protein [Chroococcidiopsis cubana]|nr:hypothetical protein [Chroococcidiopsis cubana]